MKYLADLLKFAINDNGRTVRLAALAVPVAVAAFAVAAALRAR
ncbi:hypothetical protein GCM10009839_71290 [Catenulispora yoronensis]|uniref:Uncharacterized protein n=1 Tax=Catenulispora yoronensis TaxID=450799 RepID=A0ABN2V6U6_9ACTN